MPERNPGPHVVLTLDRASAERLESGDILFRCKLTLENHSGAELIVQSNFFSAFDGMILVVRDESGRELKRQPYVFHQAPLAAPRGYPLPTGKTAKTIVFPVDELPAGRTRFKLQVVGTLPGSGYEPELSSKVLDVRLVGD